eukprot:5209385-Pyramimonas_sp.AAC.1
MIITLYQIARNLEAYKDVATTSFVLPGHYCPAIPHGQYIVVGRNLFGLGCDGKFVMVGPLFWRLKPCKGVS